MPALSGSDTAYKQARAGIERAGASRANYYTVNHVVTINSVDFTASVERSSLSVRLELNDEPDSASFMLRSGSSVPTTGHQVVVGLGTAANRLFAGQIIDLQHVRVQGFDAPWMRVTCSDWSKLFDRRLITGNFSGYTATEIATFIVEGYATGFTGTRIQDGLATVNEFLAENAKPSALLRDLATRIGGGFYVDANKDLHFWGPGGETGSRAPTNPTTITTSLSTLKEFQHTYDFTQVRTRAICEGRSGKTVVAIPAGTDLSTYGIPIDHDGQWFFNTAIDASNQARVGTLLVGYDEMQNVLGPPYMFVGIAASAGDTSLSLTDGTGYSGIGPFWVYDPAENYFAGTSFIPAGITAVLGGIPASGYGSINVDLPVGTPIYQTGRLSGIVELSNHVGIEQGDAVIVRAQVDDTSAQTAIGAIEGGDGIHEHIVKDDTLTHDGCVERAQSELDSFSASLTRASWVTYDMNARPGAQQIINITGTGALSVTETIESVTLDFPIPNHPPRRSCEASAVKVADLFDAIIHGL